MAALADRRASAGPCPVRPQGEECSMPGKLPFIVFSDREGPEDSWTLADFFAEGLTQGMLGFVIDGVNDETLGPFGEAGIPVDAAELLANSEIAALGGADTIEEAAPTIAQMFMEELAEEIGELLGPLRADETREERQTSLFWAGWFSSPDALALLAAEVGRIAGEAEDEDE
jgi:hypothetical protein